eukprot:9259473-Alexandrium_andersonii.AAC.1
MSLRHVCLPARKGLIAPARRLATYCCRVRSSTATHEAVGVPGADRPALTNQPGAPARGRSRDQLPGAAGPGESAVVRAPDRDAQPSAAAGVGQPRL